MRAVLSYAIVDAFAQGPYTANPAGVVLHADELDEDQMCRIAREINLAETAFISRMGDGSRPAEIRWFTPVREVCFCGHATLGAAHVLRGSGLAAGAKSGFTVEAGGGSAATREETSNRVEFESKAGVLRVEFEGIGSVAKIGNAGSAWLEEGAADYREPDGLWWLSMPDAGLKPDNTNPMLTVELLGMTMDELDPRVPILRTRDEDLILMIRSWDTLVKLRPKFDELGRWGDEHGIRGFFVTTTQTVDASVQAQSRFFAPSFGINEDPVTGSAHGALGAILLRYKLLPEVEGCIAANCIQGEPGGRTGLVRILVETIEGRAVVRVGGRCCTTMLGRLRVPVRA